MDTSILRPSIRTLIKQIPQRLGPLRRGVHVFPADEVTTISEHEVEPEAGGMTQEQVEAIWSAIVTLYKTGVHPAIAITLRRKGEIILDRAIGHAQGNSPGTPLDAPKEQATPEHLYNFFSGSKAITAMLIHHLDDRGLLHVDDPVAEYIPEFAQKGKELVTIRHLLSHRAGIPTTEGLMDLDYLDQPEVIRRLYCEAEAQTVPGRRLAYHALTGGFVLGDIIREVTGKSIQQYLREVVREPLGFENLAYGVSEEKLSSVARDVYTGLPAVPPVSTVFRRGFGASMKRVCELACDPRFLRAVVPSGNIIAKPREISRYFELLLRGGKLDGTRVFRRRTVQRARIETTYGEFDDVLHLPIRYSMGFMLGGDRLSFYGADSKKAFGHLGFTRVLGWADPERDISVALMNTGKPLFTPESVLWLRMLYVIAAQVPKLPQYC